jgi:quinol monooxygenase YgiN
MISVLATVTVREGRREDFLAEFKKIAPKVRAERGCIEYGAWIDLPTNIEIQGPERSDVLVCVEKWESVEALETHLIAPHMIEFRKAIEAMRAAIDLEILQPAAP